MRGQKSARETGAKNILPLLIECVIMVPDSPEKKAVLKRDISIFSFQLSL